MRVPRALKMQINLRIKISMQRALKYSLKM